jgi:hypothetical protein
LESHSFRAATFTTQHHHETTRQCSHRRSDRRAYRRGSRTVRQSAQGAPEVHGKSSLSWSVLSARIERTRTLIMGCVKFLRQNGTPPALTRARSFLSLVRGKHVRRRGNFLNFFLPVFFQLFPEMLFGASYKALLTPTHRRPAKPSLRSRVPSSLPRLLSTTTSK